MFSLSIILTYKKKKQKKICKKNNICYLCAKSIMKIPNHHLWVNIKKQN